jgi:hypothetical protein
MPYLQIKIAYKIVKLIDKKFSLDKFNPKNHQILMKNLSSSTQIIKIFSNKKLDKRHS